MSHIYLKPGDKGEQVRRLQLYLCRVSASLWQIPKIGKPDGIYGVNTKNAVTAFQRMYFLPADGIVDTVTWEKICDTYAFFARVENLYYTYDNMPKQHSTTLSLGSRGTEVVTAQYYLSLLRELYPLPEVKIDGIYGENTVRTVGIFQRERSLPISGEVDLATREALWSCYKGMIKFLTKNHALSKVDIPKLTSLVLSRGKVGPPVRALKACLAFVFDAMGISYSFEVNNSFDMKTQYAVSELQRIFSLPQSGKADEKTIATLMQVYRIISAGKVRLERQYPGYAVGRGCGDTSAVYDVQTALRRQGYCRLFPDGSFGEETVSAVAHYQEKHSLPVTGDVDYELWLRLVCGNTQPPTRQAPPM